jgi:ParB/RepB/Spo0J family partition protein
MNMARGDADQQQRSAGQDQPHRLQQVPVARIRPEDGLGRKRDREGHKELCRSIEQFGVLTPITVRPAPDGSGDYLLIKGQGRALACNLLDMKTIPAIVVSDAYADDQKVQEFLVENVARLKMRPIDRALLIAHARRDGEETAEVAARFGVSAATVRRLEAQLDGASSGEVAALRAGSVNLAMHAVITRHVASAERAEVIDIISTHTVRTREMDAVFLALGWRELAKLGDEVQDQRLRLLDWVCSTLTSLPAGLVEDRLRELALQLPVELPGVLMPVQEARL